MDSTGAVDDACVGVGLVDNGWEGYEIERERMMTRQRCERVWKRVNIPSWQKERRRKGVKSRSEGRMEKMGRAAGDGSRAGRDGFQQRAARPAECQEFTVTIDETCGHFERMCHLSKNVSGLMRK